MTRESNERIALDPPAAIMGLRSPKAHETKKTTKEGSTSMRSLKSKTKHVIFK
jgi:hypothetical protein